MAEMTHILLVEDTPAVREVLTRQFQALGVKVSAVEDGKEALERVAHNRFDLILTDLNMPEMDGLQFAKALREQEHDLGIRTPVVLLTANPAQVRPEDFLFDDFLQKPVAIEDLKKLLVGEKADNKFRGIHLAASIDRDILIEQMGELDEGAIMMLKLFPKMMRPTFDKILEAAQLHDFESLGHAAHSLKGAARSAGAMRLGVLCADIQDCAQHKKSALYLIPLLEEEYRRVEIDLDQI